MERLVELKVTQSQALWKLLGPSLYSSRPLFPVTVRELAQNAFDAQLKTNKDVPVVFEMSISEDQKTVYLSCEDQGVGMTPDVIFDKFLALGESGKSAGVGGYGVAKAAILGACSEWDVQTLGYQFDSSKLGVAGLTEIPVREGTKITLSYRADENSKLKPNYYSVKEAVELLIANAPKSKLVIKGTPKEVECGGVEVKESMLLKRFTSDVTQVSVYQIGELEDPKVPYVWWTGENSSKASFSGVCESPKGGRVFFRIGGLTQAVEKQGPDDSGFNLVVDIETAARPGEQEYPLTTSREQMTGSLRDTVAEYLRRVFMNPHTEALLLKERAGVKKVKKIFHEGDVCRKTKTEIKNEEKRVAFNDRVEEAKGEIAEFLNRTLETMAPVMAPVQNTLRTDTLSGLVQTDVSQSVVIMAPQPVTRLQRTPQGIATFLRVEKKYWNREWINSKNLRFLQVWVSMLETLMNFSPVVASEYGIGMVFDDDFCALRTVEGDTVYYLFNPSRFRLTHRVETVISMLQSAAHEVSHAVYEQHGEKFSVFSENLFNKIIQEVGFKQIRKWAAMLR